jgi:DNA polymerase III epsilon subunit-like protein
MFIYLDTETTGTGPDDRLCQIAFKPNNGPIASGLFNPGKPISVDTMVVHHITDKMVRDKPPFKGSDLHARLKAMAGDADKVIVAHNAQYDMKILRAEGIHCQRVICSLKLARHLDKNGVIPKYNLQYLRYFLNLEIDASAHDASGDVLVLEGIFNRLYGKFKEDPKLKDPVQEMIKISNNPVLVSRMPYGKHKGMLFRDVPKDYLEWLQTTELDEDMAYTVKEYLGRLPG